jgi:hypothetical protein
MIHHAEAGDGRPSGRYRYETKDTKFEGWCIILFDAQLHYISIYLFVFVLPISPMLADVN